MAYKAVIFDLGGVVFGSPIAGINEYEKINNLPRNFINIFIIASKDNAFKRLERGQTSIPEFLRVFRQELNDPSAIDIYIKYMQQRKGVMLKRCNFPKNGFEIDTVDMFNRMNAHSMQTCEEMLFCLKKLKELKLVRLALTNNFKAMNGEKKNELLQYFDGIVESAVVGIRKPNPKIFEIALDEINGMNEQKERVKYEEIIFLDDIGTNLKSAAKLGIKTIKVGMTQQIKAINELEATLGLEPNTLTGKQSLTAAKL